MSMLTVFSVSLVRFILRKVKDKGPRGAFKNPMPAAIHQAFCKVFRVFAQECTTRVLLKLNTFLERNTICSMQKCFLLYWLLIQQNIDTVSNSCPLKAGSTSHRSRSDEFLSSSCCLTFIPWNWYRMIRWMNCPLGRGGRRPSWTVVWTNE